MESNGGQPSTVKDNIVHFHDSDNSFFGVYNKYQQGWTEEDESRRVFLTEHKCKQKPPTMPHRRAFGSETFNTISNESAFKRCLEMQGCTYVLEGKLGAGKTTTMARLIQHVNEDVGDQASRVQNEQKDANDAGGPFVASVFLDLDLAESTQKDAASILLRLLADLTSDGKIRGDGVDQIMRFCKKNNARPTPSDVADQIISTLKLQSPACFFIDALGACDDATRKELLCRLRTIQSETKIGLVLSSRHNECDWEKYFEKDYEVFDLRAHDKDIETFLRHELEHSDALWAKDETHCRSVMKTVVERSSGIFLIAALQITFLNQTGALEKDLESIRTASAHLERGGHDSLSKYYQEMYNLNVQRVVGQGNHYQAARATFTLGAIRDALQPLTTTELLEMHRIDTIHNSAPKRGDLVPWHAIASACHGLVETDKLGCVSLIHPSLMAYLKSEGGKVQIKDHHRMLAQVCLVYLTMGSCNDGACTNQKSLIDRDNKWPLLYYAAKWWYKHIRYYREVASTASKDDELSLRKLLLQFLTKKECVESANQIASLGKLRRYTDKTASRGTFPPMRSSVLTVTFTYNSRKPADDLFTSNSTTGLHLVCRYGSRYLVGLLLQYYIIHSTTKQLREIVNQQDSSKSTPLFCAIESGDVSIFQSLLDIGASYDIVDEKNMTPFLFALNKGNGTIAKKLLDKCPIGKRAEMVNKATVLPANESSRQASIRFDRSEGRLCRVTMTETAAVGSRTAFITVAKTGDLAMFNVLRRIPGIDKFAQDSHGETAMHKAAKYGHLEIVKALIAEGLDPRAQASYGPDAGHNALHIASKFPLENLEVVEYLSKLPNQSTSGFLCMERTKDGQTPLHLAARAGNHEKVKSILNALGRPQSDILLSMEDDRGETPLHHAAKCRRSDTSALQFILRQPGVDTGRRDFRSYSPLHTACEVGNDNAVRVLLRETDLAVLQSEPDLLLLSDQAGRSTIIRTLLEDKRVPTDELLMRTFDRIERMEEEQLDVEGELGMRGRTLKRESRELRASQMRSRDSHSREFSSLETDSRWLTPTGLQSRASSQTRPPTRVASPTGGVSPIWLPTELYSRKQYGSELENCPHPIGTIDGSCDRCGRGPVV